MTRYRVNVQRGQRFWLIHVPELDQWSQARNLSEVEAMSRDLIAVMTQVTPESFDLDVSIELPPSARKHIAEAARLRDGAKTMQRQAALESREAVRLLLESGLSQREIAKVLGVSPQRASQLVRS